MDIVLPEDWLMRFGSERIVWNERDGSWLVVIPEGHFLAGKEKITLSIPAYCLALHTVTNIQYARFLNEMRPPAHIVSEWIEMDAECFVRRRGDGYEAYGQMEMHPVLQVSWYGAKAYCDWAGLRLPSELEWEKGSRGIDGREFPWGDLWDQSKCRNGANRGDEKTCSIWEYPEGNSPWGIYQMAGNVWEWCEDWYESGVYDRYSKGDMRPPESGTDRVVRGGSWGFIDPGYFLCAHRDYDEPSVLKFDLNGFRCAKNI